MNDTIATRYKTAFKELLFPLGFKLYRKTFYRRINNLFQGIMLEKTETHFRINVDLCPLSLPIKDLYLDGIYDLSMFRKQQKGSWECYDDLWKAAFEEIIPLFQEIVMPIFEQVTDSNIAIDTIMAIDRNYYTVKNPELFHSSLLKSLCLSAGRYDMAFALMIRGEEEWEENFRWFEEKKKQGVYENVKRNFYNEFMEEYFERKELLEHLSPPDELYLAEYIKKKEAITLELLAHPRY